MVLLDKSFFIKDWYLKRNLPTEATWQANSQSPACHEKDATVVDDVPFALATHAENAKTNVTAAGQRVRNVLTKA